MKRKLYIHAGAGKTATTAIQSFLLRNVSQLQSNGCLYPEVGRQYSAHHPLAALFLPHTPGWVAGTSETETIDALIDEIEASECETAIISSEVFFYATKLREMQEYFRRYDTRVLFYLRRQDEWLESIYRQDLKVGETTETAAEFLRRRGRDGKFFSRLEAWAAVFGRGSIQAHLFRSDPDGNPIEQSFLRSCGVDWSDGYLMAGRANERLNRDSLRFLMLLPEKPRYGADYDRVFQWLADYSRERPDEAENRFLFSPQQRRQVLEDLRSENVALAERYLGECGGDYFDAAVRSISERWQPYSGLSAEKAVEIAWYLMSRIGVAHP